MNHIDTGVKPTREDDIYLAQVISTLACLNGGRMPRMPEPTIPEERPCLNCGKPKRHNNSFCSPECCKAYKKARQL